MERISEDIRHELAKDMARGAYIRKLLDPGFLQENPRADKYVEEHWEERYLPFVATTASELPTNSEVSAEIAMIEEAIAAFVDWRNKYGGKL